jgi:hypothetical protein
MKHWNITAKSLISDRFGRRLAAQLDHGTLLVHADITERLRLAREQALARRRVVEFQAIPVVHATPSGTLTLGWGWGTRLSSLLPAILLLVGLLMISAVGEDQRAHELADVDTELLLDELPPDAYIDPGFAKYLQIKGRE